MLEILEFIFSSFWVWLGTLMLVAVIGGCMAVCFTGMFIKQTKTNNYYGKSKNE